MARTPLELFCYCLMRNHWHLVLRPAADGDLSDFLRWSSATHTQRWHAAHHTSGTGHLYLGRFKSFPVEADEHHFLAVCRYVERNALRAGLCRRAEEWRWCSLWRRAHGRAAGGEAVPALAAWPVEEPVDWAALVNRPQSVKEEQALRTSIAKGRPFGSEHYQTWTAEALGLGSAFRDRGRPRKGAARVKMENDS